MLFPQIPDSVGQGGVLRSAFLTSSPVAQSGSHCLDKDGDFCNPSRLPAGGGGGNGEEESSKLLHFKHEHYSRWEETGNQGIKTVVNKYHSLSKHFFPGREDQTL